MTIDPSYEQKTDGEKKLLSMGAYMFFSFKI